MSHLDEGTLTALLDNELAGEERQQAEQHLASCGECRQLFEEIRGFAGEADQLVDSVQPAERMPRKPVPARPRWDQLRPLAWAATLVIAAGLGWSASGLRLNQGDLDTAAGGLAEQKAPAGPTATAEDEAALPSAEDARERPAPRSDQAPERQATEPPASVSTDMAKSASPAPRPEADMAENAAGRAEAPAAAALRQAPANPPAAPLAAEPLQSRVGEVAGGRDIARRTNLYRPTSLEQAVQILGGTVKLIDGLTPTAVGIRPPQLAGEDPGLEVIRITYLDPPGRQLWLDQQRSPVQAEGRAAPSAADGMLAGDTLVTSAGEGLTRVRWISQDGFRLTLTGYLPGDSLRILVRRVH